MWFAYMDEAGNTGRKCDDPNQPIHLILTLAVDEENVARLHKHVREMAQRHCPADCEKYDFEFHGQDLFSGRGSFEGRSAAERVEVFDDVLKGIAIADGDIVIRGVDKVGLHRRYPDPFHPHDIALMFTVESIERIAKAGGCRFLLIADEAKEVEHAAIRDLANYSRIRKIRDGLVRGGESAEAVERLWEERIAPHVRADEVWYPT